MSFNFQAFMTAMTKMLPAIGEAVIALHPDNPNEALKIRTGTALVTAVAQSLQDASQPDQASTASPAPGQQS